MIVSYFLGRSIKMDFKIIALVVLISVVYVSEAKPYEEFRKLLCLFKRIIF